MKKVNEPEQLNAVRARIDNYFGNVARNYSLQDLFEWESNSLSFVSGAFPWLGFGRPAADAKDILNAGIGKCGEYAIVYTAACLSVGIVTLSNSSCDKNGLFQHAAYALHG